MADVITIEASVRKNIGTSGAREVRRAAMIPCIVYGGEKDPVAIQLDRRIILKELETEGFLSRLFNLNVDGKNLGQVIPRAIQFHPVTDDPLHVDFMRVTKGSKIHVALPIHFENEAKSPGLKRGGVLNVVVHELEVECSASAIPEYISIDVSTMDIGDTVHLNQLTLPQDVRPLHMERDNTIATIVAPSAVRSKESTSEEETTS